MVLTRLQDAGLQVNVLKSSFCTIEMEYLEYILMCTGIKPQPKMVKVILVILPQKQVKDLCRFPGMVQYYRDFWARHSKMLALLTSLVQECGHTKVTKTKKTKKSPWHWDGVHQKAFYDLLATITKDVVLAYPDYSKEFEISFDALSTQLGSVITQGNGSLVFSAGNFPQCNKNSASPSLNHWP
jgi:hypothetical protein